MNSSRAFAYSSAIHDRGLTSLEQQVSITASNIHTFIKTDKYPPQYPSTFLTFIHAERSMMSFRLLGLVMAHRQIPDHMPPDLPVASTCSKIDFW
jgi:hypothetical protein